ncbi:Serine protease snake [Papilio machaon]|uniref:Acrosin n=1 Tax=Papilio machaon TaxID=76193 RepID=A0A194RM65_PAPMA|nr:Serine protease snake [Papilio machaon]
MTQKFESCITSITIENSDGEDVSKNKTSHNTRFIDPLIEEQSVKLWNATTGELDKLQEKNNDYCKPMYYYTPDFRAEGRRVSEVSPDRDMVGPVVVGGDDAEVGEIPHMGAIGWLGAGSEMWVFKCGGVLISDKFVLTASHCSRVTSRDTTVTNITPQIVRFGTVNILGVDKNGVPPQDVRISRFIVHDKYHAPKTSFIHPACLWTKENEISGKGIVAGWGVVDTASRRTSSKLQVAAVDMVPSEECNNTLKRRRNRNWSHGLASHQICAGHMSGGIDACQGDSGGPLHIKLQMPIDIQFEWRMHYVVGVTSFGHGCALANTPSVFSKVSHFIDWIENIVWEKEVNVTLKENVKSK